MAKTRDTCLFPTVATTEVQGMKLPCKISIRLDILHTTLRCRVIELSSKIRREIMVYRFKVQNYLLLLCAIDIKNYKRFQTFQEMIIFKET